MIAGARDVNVSPSIIGTFSRKEAALVEVLIKVKYKKSPEPCTREQHQALHYL
jgi:hypothetical protein